MTMRTKRNNIRRIDQAVGFSPTTRRFPVRILVILSSLIIFGISTSTFRSNVFARFDPQNISIIEPDIREFPTIRYSLKIFDANQRPIAGLEASQVQVIEDGQSIPLVGLKETYSGIHTILAINADRDLDMRDSTGTSHYEKLISSIDSWQSVDSTNEGNLWSLTLNQGRQYICLTDRQAWLTAIQNYQPDLRNAQGNLTSLTAAIDNAALDTTEMDQVLIYITPEPLAEDIPTLLSLTQQAVGKKLSIHIWMVGKQYVLDTERGKALFNLAQQTGGSFFTFEGNQDIPDPQAYFSDLGYKYSLIYTSKIVSSGTHTAQITVDMNGEMVTSSELSFYVDVQPPSPIFASPPMNIDREILPVNGSLTDPQSQATQEINIQIEFPDGHPRPLKYVRLFVNDELVQENLEPPFETFTWNYSNITTDTTCILQIKLEDSLGLQVTSAQIPVQVKVTQVQPESTKNEIWNSEWLIPVIVSAAALTALVTTLIKLSKRKASPALKLKGSPTSTHQKMPKKKKSSGYSRPASFARLVKVNQDDQPCQEEPIGLSGPIVIFGSDPILANVRLTDPSIESTHSRLLQLSNGKFILADLGSSSGTWVNYAPVSEMGAPLEDGDLIHIGRVAFRFLISYKDPQKRS
jgi:hypothetical protein